jgi:hypothetical protein
MKCALRTASLIGAAAFVAAACSAPATPVPPLPAAGRYQITSPDSGYVFRLDTTTGEVTAFFIARDRDLHRLRDAGIDLGEMRFIELVRVAGPDATR